MSSGGSQKRKLRERLVRDSCERRNVVSKEEGVGDTRSSHGDLRSNVGNAVCNAGAVN